MAKKEWYQMDLFDLEDNVYQPVARKIDPRAIGTMYLCPKCKAMVGYYIEDDGWTQRVDTCRNGHRIKWED